MLNSNDDGTLTLNRAFTEFISDSEAKNLSKRTIDYYRYCYKWALKTMPDDSNMYTISKKEINSHIRFLMKSNKATSVNTHLRGLRTFFNYSNETYGTNIKIRLIKADKQPKPTYSDGELKQLLKKPNIDLCSLTEYRDWVMTNVFMGTGCRLGSCISLKAKDINLEASTIYFRKMKNRKALLLPMNEELREVLIEYFKHRCFSGDDLIFTSRKGGKLTDSGFNSAYRAYAERRGVANAGIHKFRHTYAKQFILSGGNPAKLQRILGHSTINITMEYVNLYSVDLREDVNKYCFLKKETVVDTQ